MKTCHRLLCLMLLLTFGTFHTQSTATAEAESAPTANLDSHDINADAKFVVISEDVIPDLENTTQKVIRVNPLDLPAILNKDTKTSSEDSSLYTIQTLLPVSGRNYINSNRMRRPRPQLNAFDERADSQILRHISPESKPQKSPKKKHLHFLYNQETLDGTEVGKNMRVHVAPGAYPIYYAVSKSNGRFGKYPLKDFRNPTEFMKYLLRTKVATVETGPHSES